MKMFTFNKNPNLLLNLTLQPVYNPSERQNTCVLLMRYLLVYTLGYSVTAWLNEKVVPELGKEDFKKKKEKSAKGNPGITPSPTLPLKRCIPSSDWMTQIPASPFNLSNIPAFKGFETFQKGCNRIHEQCWLYKALLDEIM